MIGTIARMTNGELPGCVIVSGMPGAGKSTVTRLAAGLFPRAARVGGDDVNLMIGSGFVWFMGKPTDEALRQDELCKRNMCSLASNFVDFGFTVLMDSVLVDRPELDFFLALLSPRPVRLVILAPGIDVCRRRNDMRDAGQELLGRLLRCQRCGVEPPGAVAELPRHVGFEPLISVEVEPVLRVAHGVPAAAHLDAGREYDQPRGAGRQQREEEVQFRPIGQHRVHEHGEAEVDEVVGE